MAKYQATVIIDDDGQEREYTITGGNESMVNKAIDRLVSDETVIHISNIKKVEG